MGANILILGGGVGGLVAANELRKLLSKEHPITLVDRAPSFVFSPSLLWLLIGERTAKQITRPLARLQRKGIDLVVGEIQRVDPKQREVIIDGQSRSFDFLVIALGAELFPESVPGLAEAQHNIYTLRGAETFHQALTEFRGGRIVVLTAAPAYKCPAAPYEAAMLVDQRWS